MSQKSVGENATDDSSVRRGSIVLRAVRRTLVRGPAAALPPAVSKTKTKDKFGVLIRNDCRITTSELFTLKGNGKEAGMAITRERGYRKVCAK
jgi:hypothetical protein